MFLPQPQAGCQHESRGENTSNSAGTSVTAAASSHTKGSWANLGSTTSFAYEGFTLFLSRPSIATDSLTDIGIDAGGGAVSILLPDFHLAALKLANEPSSQMFIPIHVPAGSQLVARTQASSAGNIVYTKVTGHSKNPGGFPGYSRAIKLFTGGSSRGDAIDPGTSANTKGAWAQLIASVSDNIEAICCVIGHAGDTSRAATGVGYIDIGVGAGGSENIIIPDLACGWGITYDGPTDQFYQPMACRIAAGQRLAARAQSNLTTGGDRTMDLAVWGFT